MRLVLLSIGILTLTGLVLLCVRLFGLSQQGQTFEHAWFHQPKPWVVVPWSAKNQAPTSAILWLDVYMDKDQTLYALRSPSLAGAKELSTEQLAAEAVELSSALSDLENRNLVLNICSNKEGVDLKVAATFGKNFDSRILVQSDFDVVLDSIKALKPMWLYGSTLSQRVRYRTLQSLWIEPAMNFRGDVYLGPFSSKGVELLSTEILQDLERRNKHIIVGPLKDHSDLELAKRLGVDGVFIDKIELLRIL